MKLPVIKLFASDKMIFLFCLTILHINSVCSMWLPEENKEPYNFPQQNEQSFFTNPFIKHDSKIEESENMPPKENIFFNTNFNNNGNELESYLKFLNRRFHKTPSGYISSTLLNNNNFENEVRQVENDNPIGIAKEINTTPDDLAQQYFDHNGFNSPNIIKQKTATVSKVSKTPELEISTDFQNEIPQTTDFPVYEINDKNTKIEETDNSLILNPNDIKKLKGKYLRTTVQNLKKLFANWKIPNISCTCLANRNAKSNEQDVFIPLLENNVSSNCPFHKSQNESVIKSTEKEEKESLAESKSTEATTQPWKIASEAPGEPLEETEVPLEITTEASGNLESEESRKPLEFTSEAPLEKESEVTTEVTIEETTEVTTEQTTEITSDMPTTPESKSAIAFLKMKDDKINHIDLLSELLKKKPEEYLPEEKELLDNILISSKNLSENAKKYLEKKKKQILSVVVIPEKSVHKVNQVFSDFKAKHQNLELEIRKVEDEITPLPRKQKDIIIKIATLVLQKIDTTSEVNFKEIYIIFDLIPQEYLDYDDKIFKLNPYKFESIMPHVSDSLKELRGKLQNLEKYPMTQAEFIENMKMILNILLERIKNAPISKMSLKELV